MIMKTPTLINDKPIKFYDYLLKNPHLYDNITGYSEDDITRLNVEFWELELNPATFYRKYTSRLNMVKEQYLLMKANEFNDKISELITNDRLRTIINNTTNNLTRTSNRNSTTTSTSRVTNNSDNTNQEANRALPMTSPGTDFEDILDWSHGASTAAENRSDSESITTGNDTINTGDIASLTDLNTAANNGSITDKEMNDQAVTCIERIWSYLSKPKSFHWLCEQLESCFILIL